MPHIIVIAIINTIDIPIMMKCLSVCDEKWVPEARGETPSDVDDEDDSHHHQHKMRWDAYRKCHTTFSTPPYISQRHWDHFAREKKWWIWFRWFFLFTFFPLPLNNVGLEQNYIKGIVRQNPRSLLLPKAVQIMNRRRRRQKCHHQKCCQKMSSTKMMLPEANSSKEDAHYVQVFFVAQLTPSKLSSRTNFLRLKLT